MSVIDCEPASRDGDFQFDGGEGQASSSPSMNIVTLTGRSSSAAPKTRSAPRCAAMPALSSAAPRAYSRSPRSVGSNGGLSQSAWSFSGWTSWWA